MQIPMVQAAGERASDVVSTSASNARKQVMPLLSFSAVLAQRQYGALDAMVSKATPLVHAPEQVLRERETRESAVDKPQLPESDSDIDTKSTVRETTSEDRVDTSSPDADDVRAPEEDRAADTPQPDSEEVEQLAVDGEASAAYASVQSAGSNAASTSVQESLSVSAPAIEGVSGDASAALRTQLLRTLLDLMKAAGQTMGAEAVLDDATLTPERVAQMLGVSSDNELLTLDELAKLLVTQNRQPLVASSGPATSAWLGEVPELVESSGMAQATQTKIAATFSEWLRALGVLNESVETTAESQANASEASRIMTGVPGTVKSQGTVTVDAVPSVAAVASMNSETPLPQGAAAKAETLSGVQAVDHVRMAKLLQDNTVRAVRYLATQGEKTLTLKLIPESLGELHLEVTSGQDGLNVRLMSANSVVRSILNTDLPSLRDALLRDGLQILNVSVMADTSSSYTTTHQQSGTGGESTFSAFNSAPKPETDTAVHAAGSVSSSWNGAVDGALNVLV